MAFFKNNSRLIFYLAWIILGLIQSRFTELLDDEAYYWVYSKYPDWGYFDHPPLTAILIKAGYAIFPNELGVRIFPFLLHILTLVILEQLANKKNPFLFQVMALSVAMLQLTGFNAVPDTLLIFCTALFFLCYKNLLADFSLRNAVLLGFSVALLLYSKYHGVLIVFFTVLSNLNLLKKYHLYLAGLVATLCFLPHLWWQYQHAWVSFRYHLFESNVNVYKFEYTLNYIAGQLLLPGPVAGFMLLPAAFLYKSRDLFQKALKFTMAGIYIFFLLSSFRGKVELNWTAPVVIPLFLLAFYWIDDHPKWQNTLSRLLPITIILVLFARVVMIVDVLPIREVKARFHSWKKWPVELKKTVNQVPLAFSNSYQRASKLWFYTGNMSYSQNLYKEHRNNYNFWPIEDSLVGRPVYYLDIYDLQRFPKTINTPMGPVGLLFDSSFASFAKVRIEPFETFYKINEGESLFIRCNTFVPDHYRQFISTHTSLNAELILAVFNKRGWVKDLDSNIKLEQLLNDELQVNILTSLPPGQYKLMFAIRSGHYYPTHNSNKFSLIVSSN